MTNLENICYCPKCNNEMDQSNFPMADFINLGLTAAKFNAPFFLCSSCLIAYIDENVVKKNVSFWRNTCLFNQKSKKRLPHKEMCEKVIKTLEKLLREHHLTRLSYKKIVYLNKKPRAKKKLMTNLENVRHCPKCNKEAELAIACDINHCFLLCQNLASTKRLDLPYFLCSDCRLAYIDRERIKRIIKMEMEELTPSKSKKVSYQDAYQKITKFLEEIIKDNGYKKITRFNKTPRK